VRATIDAGDAAYFRAGVYDEQDSWDGVIGFINTNHNNGSENNSITLASYPGEIAQLGSRARGYVIRHLGTMPGDTLSYWTFSKFLMRAGSSVTSWGLSQNGRDDHIRFIGNDATNYWGAITFQFDGQDGGQTYLYFYGNHAHDTAVQRRGDTVTLGTRAYPLYFEGFGSHNHIYIGWNEFDYNEKGRGLQLYGHYASDWMDNVHIHDNYFHHNGCNGAVIGGGDGGSRYTFLRTVYFYNNIVANNGHRGYAGLRIGGGGSAGNSGGKYYVFNNVFYHNVTGEFDLGGSPELVEIKNNIVIASDEYYMGYGDSSVYSGTNNCYYGASDVPGWDVGSIRMDPRIVNGESHNFRLYPDSPCVDAGTNDVAWIVQQGYDGVVRPRGIGFDIGAYERWSESGGDDVAPGVPQGLTVVDVGQ
jgi:hypothetical protein